MKTRFLKLLLLLFLFLPIQLYGQHSGKCSIEGTILNTTGQGIEYATAAILSVADSSYVSGNVADSNGKFSINNLPSGKYILYLTHLLYKRKYINIDLQGQRTLAPITMEENVNVLETVTVKASPIQHMPDRYRISLKDNPITKGNNTTQVLGLMPGVTEDRGSLKINGRNVSQIYVDGRKLVDRKELDAIRAENLDKVEVIYMAGSAEDAGSMGGVIDIKLKKVRDGGYYGSISGSYAMLAETGHYFDGVNSSFNSRYKKLSIYNYLWYSDSRSTDQYEIKSLYKQPNQSVLMETKEDGWNHTFSDRLSINLDINPKHTIGANLRVALFNGLPEEQTWSTASNHDGNVINRTGATMKTDIRNIQYQTALNYNWLIDEKGSNLKLIIDYLNYDDNTRRDNTYLYEVNTSEENSRYSYNDINNKTDMLAADARFEFKLGKTGQLNLGANYSLNHSKQLLDYRDKLEQEWHPNTTLSDNYTLKGKSVAGYASYGSSIGSKLMYKVGVRVQSNTISYNSKKLAKENSKAYWGVYPTVNLMYNIDPQKGTMLNLSYQRSMQAIPYNVITPAIIYTNEHAYTKGNLDIKPAYYNDFSFGVSIRKWNLNYMFYNGKNTLYYKTSLDETDPLTTYTMPVSSGKMIAHGFNVDRTFKITNWWNLKANAQLTWLKYGGEIGNTTSLKSYFMLTNNLNFKNGWGGNLSAFLEPTFNTEERTYKTVGAIYGNVYKYLLKNKLLVNLDLMLYARNRRLATNTSDFWSEQRNKVNQARFTIGATYNFNGGKKVDAKQTQNIQNYYELKDN